MFYCTINNMCAASNFKQMHVFVEILMFLENFKIQEIIFKMFQIKWMNIIAHSFYSSWCW